MDTSCHTCYCLQYLFAICCLPPSNIADCEDPEEEACPFCANLFQKKGLGNHKIHCRQRPLASGPRTGASDAPHRVDTATGAGALAPHAAQFERLEAILERVLEQRAPPSVQLVEHNPHGHIDVTQLFRDERARNERNEEARRLASQLQQESQLAHEERKAAADRAHEVTLKLALESSENNNLMSALIATAESHARRGRDKKAKRRKQKERNATNKSGKGDPICLNRAQAQTRLISLQADTTSCDGRVVVVSELNKY